MVIFSQLRTFSIVPVGRIVARIGVDAADGPFPAECAVSPALRLAAVRRLGEVRLALRVVAGDPSPFSAAIAGDERTIEVGDRGDTRFGIWVENPQPEEGEPTQFHRDIESLIDELSETRSLWARRLPECPHHPDSHPLDVEIAPDRVTVRCPANGEIVRIVDR